MASTAIPSGIVAGISFVGRGSGWVKALAGFKKTHHTVPDAVNAATTAFLAKLCANELATEAEKLFQAVRAGLAYKRRDLTLSVASPAAVLTAKDFVVELAYALEETEPARYATALTLREVRSAGLLETAEVSRIFAGRFGEISFALKKGARVEAVIDAIEGLGDGGGLAVNYPSDYSDCRITVEGVDATVRCTGPTLEIAFPRMGAPADLLTAFAAVREAFAATNGLGNLIV